MLSKEELDFFEKLILKKQRELLDGLKSLEENVFNATTKDSSGDLSAYSWHMPDLGTDANEREKAFLLASREGRYLYHLNEALQRIEDGTFGTCRTCNKEISKERLIALPHATQCIECKSAEESQNNHV